jgi:hypothetical protein
MIDQKQKDHYYILASIVFVMSMIILSQGFVLQDELTRIDVASAISVPKKSISKDTASEYKEVASITITAKVTGFSGIECQTTWCKANKDLPRGQKVALNSKFGKAKQVYIEKFDKYYDVIGTTDYKTDVDIWFGSDKDSASRIGSQYLTIRLIN